MSDTTAPAATPRRRRTPRVKGTTFANDQRGCSNCNLCPPDAPHCAWRLGLYPKELGPKEMGVALFPTRVAGHNCFVAFVLNPKIMPFLEKTAETHPVILMLGEAVEAILADKDIIEQIADEIGFGGIREGAAPPPGGSDGPVD